MRKPVMYLNKIEVVEDKSVHMNFFQHLYLINYFVYEANNWSDKCSSIYIL